MAKKRTDWTNQMLAEEARKYETREDFKRGRGDAYLVAVRHGILGVICGHMKSSYTDWTNEMLAEEARKYETKAAFRKANRGAYQVAVKRGIRRDICGHMKHGSTKWTDEMLAEEARKYETRADFRKGDLGAHAAAWKRGILDDICGHMEALRTDWTNEMLAEEALKYETRVDLRRGNLGAYAVALRRGILDDISQHMVDGSPSDNDAIYIWRAVGHRYGGEDVYKIGVTSARLGDQRIDQVARKAGIEADVVILKAVPGKASDLEGELLRLGEDPQYVGMDGATEFRALSEEDVEQALEMIEGFCAEGRGQMEQKLRAVK